jgi:hypothetical protein
MRQEIHDAMGEHADKERERWFIKHSRHGEVGTDRDKRMHADCHGMQRRVVQKTVECRSHGRVRQVFQRVRPKAQG